MNLMEWLKEITRPPRERALQEAVPPENEEEKRRTAEKLRHAKALVGLLGEEDEIQITLRRPH